MKVAIIGTRGIPNHYGGFEQCAQYLSLGLVQRGHQVWVYNSHNHVYKEPVWNGIHIIHRYDPEQKIGTAGQFIYDLGCILDTRRRHFDIILNLGYTSSSVWGRLFPKKSVVITNMDGLEWKRSKYSKKVQRFLKYAERLAIRHSDVLVADSPGILKYLAEVHGALSHFIAYGAEPFNQPDAAYLGPFEVEPFSYNMLIARMEPENNIELILDGVHRSGSGSKFLVVGNTGNTFGQYLVAKYRHDPRIVFTGPLYDAPVINNLRYYSNLYFHGHSVGGTNPSLLEAMACKCLIAAHDNDFNKGVLQEDAFYFKVPAEITALVEKKSRTSHHEAWVMNNDHKIRHDYSWEKIVQQYESLMLSVMR